MPRAAGGSGKHQQLCCRSVPKHICLRLSLWWPCQNLGCCCSCMPCLLLQVLAPSSWARTGTLTLALPTKVSWAHQLTSSISFSFTERFSSKPLCQGEAIKMGLTADIVDGPSKLPTEMRKHHRKLWDWFLQQLLQRGQRRCAKISQDGSCLGHCSGFLLMKPLL